MKKLFRSQNIKKWAMGIAAALIFSVVTSSMALPLAVADTNATQQSDAQLQKAKKEKQVLEKLNLQAKEKGSASLLTVSLAPGQSDAAIALTLTGSTTVNYKVTNLSSLSIPNIVINPSYNITPTNLLITEVQNNTCTTLPANGTCTFTVSLQGNNVQGSTTLMPSVAGFNGGLQPVIPAVSQQIAVTVSGSTPPPVTLSSVLVTPKDPSIIAGTTQQFDAKAIYSDGTTQDVTSSATWSSATHATATINISSGLATGVAAGTSNITAVYQGVTSNPDSLTVTAQKTLSSIAISPSTVSVPNGDSLQFTAIGTYSDSSTADITSQATWTSSQTGVATIGSSNGLATAVAISGTSNIQATFGGKTSNTAVLTAVPTGGTLVSIVINPNPVSAAVGTTQQFTATGVNANGTQSTLTQSQLTTICGSTPWSSEAPGKATINTATGVATPVAAGTSVIKLTCPGITVSSATLTVPVTLTSISISPSSPTINKGATQQFSAEGTYSDGTMSTITSSVLWHSAIASVATISSDGLATGIAGGSSAITASSGSISSSSQTLTVTAPTLNSITVTPNPAGVATFISGTSKNTAPGTQQMTATGNYSDGSTANLTGSVAWSSSATNIAAIGAATGLATGAATVGSTTITAQNTTPSVSGTATLYAKTIDATTTYQGGLIYCMGTGSDVTNCAYLPSGMIGDVVAKNAVVEDRVWGGSGTAIGSGVRSNADGKSNTDFIIYSLGTNSGVDYAAYACQNYSGGTSNLRGWYLPAIDELKGVRRYMQPVFTPASGFYWSSTEHSGSYAFKLSFSAANLDPNLGTKVVPESILCVRPFLS